MVSGKEGQWLESGDVEELEAYRERGVALPDKFDDVVFDNTHGGNVGGGYRYKTAGEKQVEDEQAKTEEEAAARRAKLFEQVDKAASNADAAARVPVADVDSTGRSVTTSKGPVTNEAGVPSTSKAANP